MSDTRLKAATREGESHSGWCGSTDWSALLRAGDHSHPGAPQALEDLCRHYWQPVYAYIRRRGQDPPGAEDLTQGFFAHLLATNGLAGLDKSRGRFRSFLLVSVKHYLANEWDRQTALKRGGATRFVSLEELPAEEQWQTAESPTLSPDALYAKRWALAVLEQALARLREEELRSGRTREFTRLQSFLTVEGAGDNYVAAGAELGLSREAVAMAVCRLRQRFRQALRAEIAATVANPAEVDEELQCFAEALRQA
jgi:RNA polymerase sigma factor (sigma-70 family)